MFTVEYAKDLQWVDQAHTEFVCLAKYAEFDEEHPSGISSVDQYAHIQEIWNRGIAGDFGPIAEYTPPVDLSQQQPIVQGAQTL